MFGVQRRVRNANGDEIVGAVIVFLWASISTVLTFRLDLPMFVVLFAGLVGGLVTGFLRGAPMTSGAGGGFWAVVFGGLPFIVLGGVSYFLFLYYATRSFFLIYAPAYTLMVGSFLFIVLVIGGIIGGAIGSNLRYFLVIE